MSIDFKRGDIVWAFDEIAVIVDVLRSAETDNLCLYVRFVRNLGNARSYDMLEISPERTLGVEMWKPATLTDLENALRKRQNTLLKEIEELREFVNVDISDRNSLPKPIFRS